MIDQLLKQIPKKEWHPGDWIPYSGPLFDEAEYKAAIETIMKGWWIFGPKCREFEEAFPSYMGKKYGAFVNSGSSANFLMLAALKELGYRGKIITPVVCFPTTLNPIIQHGFEPLFVDVEPNTLNLDLAEVDKALLKHDDVVGIMFAHVLGNPPDMDRLQGIINSYHEHHPRLVILEDNCDALGSKYKGQFTGSFGLMSTCSFFPAHHMSCVEGGFVATDDPKINRLLHSLRDWGRDCHCNSKKPGDVTGGTACGNRFQKWFPGSDIVYDHRYVFSHKGYNLKPIEIQGAIGLEQLMKLPGFIKARKRNYLFLKGLFESYPLRYSLPKETEGADVGWFAFPVTMTMGSRDDFVAYLERKKIQTRPYFCGNILYHPGYQDLRKKVTGGKELKEMFPVAENVTRNTFFIGVWPGYTRDQLEYIAETIIAGSK